MDLVRLRAAVRFDSGWWRRFAELGCVYSPEWWKRGSPPVIAAIIFSIARDQRAAVLRNQRQVRGRRGWLRERWDAYRVFAECARSMTESLEQWGPHPRRITLEVPEPEIFRAALAEGRGLVVPTAHFGGWEVGARFLSDLGRPVNLVTAHEPNPTAREFIHRLRTRHGVNVIYSDQSVFAGLPLLQALRRNEVVGMQIDPWGQPQGTQTIEFCGRPAPFQLGPFAIARVAHAPVIPVFAVRTGIRRYEMRTAGRFDPTTRADTVAAFTHAVRTFERLVHEHPAQWPDVQGRVARRSGRAEERLRDDAQGLGGVARSRQRRCRGIASCCRTSAARWSPPRHERDRARGPLGGAWRRRWAATPANDQELFHLRDVDQARPPCQALLEEQPEGQEEPIVPAHCLDPPVRQTPYGEVEEPSAPGLHSEARAPLDHEGVPAEGGQEVGGIVASNVTHEDIEGAPARGMEGHREDDRGIVPRNPSELAEDLRVVLDVLDDVEGANEVEGAIAERQGRNLAERRKAAAVLQAGESRSADVDQVRAGDGEPRTQARADLESGRRRSRELRQQRPRVEALRRNQVARRPERIVEASVGGDG